MSQHTPGPWEVAGPTNAGGRCYRIQSPDPENPDFRRAPDIFASTLNDAHLIAAAPELLASLKQMKTLFFSCISDGNGELEGDREAIAEAERIIAKAEGELL